jgi:hypothetical protein
MDDVVNRLAHELVEAVGAAVADDPRVEACRERARLAGYELRLSLEAVIGVASRANPQALARVTAPAQPAGTRRRTEISATDRRFLRSLRIAADELGQQVE